MLKDKKKKKTTPPKKKKKDKSTRSKKGRITEKSAHHYNEHTSQYSEVENLGHAKVQLWQVRDARSNKVR